MKAPGGRTGPDHKTDIYSGEGCLSATQVALEGLVAGVYEVFGWIRGVVVGERKVFWLVPIPTYNVAPGRGG